MIGNRALFGLGGSPDIAALKVRNLSQPSNLAVKKRAFCRSEILAEPKDGAVYKHRTSVIWVWQKRATRNIQ
jgi:hypothetical protein